MNDLKKSYTLLYGLGAHADIPVTEEEDKTFAERQNTSAASPASPKAPVPR
jgi:hypothetical protein